ncbi:65-kDa microtubule-associated-like protein [Quillaja saponaria]|uniref:65-kDa microtubule-associated-like protein n=1 Tax=Quillaja saponaria TaxID=32244 RepID=A0AAD7LRM5_QUISA|nr:65-kDa microtubule-associated-like protein [Quillaja saponaria]
MNRCTCFTMLSNHSDQLAHIETTCGLLLNELQKIWDEVGESDVERDEMLLEIEINCLEIYRRKVDEAKKSKARLQQAIADFEAEIADICSMMGEQPLHFDRKSRGSLKRELEIIVSQLEDTQKLKAERKSQFVEVLNQLQNISNELSGYREGNLYKVPVEEKDLSLKRLEELRKKLVEFQNKKRSCLKQVSDHLNTLYSLCLVLGEDFRQKICEINPALGDSPAKDISNHTIQSLIAMVQSLGEVKIRRIQKLQNLASSLLELWVLMDTPMVEQQKFQNVTSKIAATETEFSEHNILSIDSINYVESEVSRLEHYKSSKIKEIVLRMKLELQEICRRTHLVVDLHAKKYLIESMDTGVINPESLLEQIEIEIARTKEEALIRKEIVERVEKWLEACQEESWLEEYNRDDNRYSGGRGAHLALKRAEKARVLVNKIPGMVEVLTSKVTAWEKDRGIEFLYDGVRLLLMLEEYGILRQEKDHEKQRQRDQKRLQGQLMAEQEAIFGSKPSPSKSGKKVSRNSAGVASNRKLSLGGAFLQDPKLEKTARHMHSNKKGNSINQKSSQIHKQYGGSATSSAGRKLPEVVGYSLKQNSSNANNKNEISSPVVRKPLSPISSRVLSEENVANFLEDQKIIHNGTPQRLLAGNHMPMGSPPKPINVGDEEMRTSKTMQIPVPTTPLASVPMLTARTPDTPIWHYCCKDCSPN